MLAAFQPSLSPIIQNGVTQLERGWWDLPTGRLKHYYSINQIFIIHIIRSDEAFYTFLIVF